MAAQGMLTFYIGNTASYFVSIWHLHIPDPSSSYTTQPCTFWKNQTKRCIWTMTLAEELKVCRRDTAESSE